MCVCVCGTASRSGTLAQRGGPRHPKRISCGDGWLLEGFATAMSLGPWRGAAHRVTCVNRFISTARAPLRLLPPCLHAQTRTNTHARKHGRRSAYLILPRFSRLLLYPRLQCWCTAVCACTRCSLSVCLVCLSAVDVENATRRWAALGWAALGWAARPTTAGPRVAAAARARHGPASRTRLL